MGNNNRCDHSNKSLDTCLYQIIEERKSAVSIQYRQYLHCMIVYQYNYKTGEQVIYLILEHLFILFVIIEKHYNMYDINLIPIFVSQG